MLKNYFKNLDDILSRFVSSKWPQYDKQKIIAFLNQNEFLELYVKPYIDFLSHHPQQKIRVLEIGCGDLSLMYFLLKMISLTTTLEYVGVDIDNENVDKINLGYTFKEADFICADAANIEELSTNHQKLFAEKFDVLVMISPIVEDPKDMPSAKNLELARLNNHPRYETMKANHDGLIKQFHDFNQIFAKTIPCFMKPGSLFLTKTYYPEELPCLKARLINQIAIKQEDSHHLVITGYHGSRFATAKQPCGPFSDRYCAFDTYFFKPEIVKLSKNVNVETEKPSTYLKDFVA